MDDIKVITTEDGSHSLFNSRLNETYHSIHGAIQESIHVFIKNGLTYKLDIAAASNYRILEIGFGTGLNALLTCIHVRDTSGAIYYKSWEAHPVGSEIADQLNYGSVLNSADIFRNIHNVQWQQDVELTSNFVIHKHKGNLLTDSVEDDPKFDIIYYDAFGPSKQPEMWSIEVLSKVVHVMAERGVFVTYCAKGQVKRDLKSLGLIVETLPGPPGKLQMIRAKKP